MFVVDMHCDSLMMVSRNSGLINDHNFSIKHPQLQFVAHFSECRDRSPEERRRALVRDIDIYLSECERLGIRRILSGSDLCDFAEGDFRAALFSIEGGAGLFADSEELDTAIFAGLSVFGPAWDSNELAASAFGEDDFGLTEKGKELILKLDRLGVIIDVSHMSDRAFGETLDLIPSPVIATHSNFRDVCSNKRNLTEDMARRINTRGGIVGLNLYPPFLNGSGRAGTDDIIRHVDYALERFGDRFLAFGFDIDGTDGLYPEGIDPSCSIHDQLADLLLSRYSSETVERIAYKNALEFLCENLQT